MIKTVKNIINKNYETMLISLLLLISFLSFFQTLNSMFSTIMLISICFIVFSKYINIEKGKIKLKINKDIKIVAFIMFLFCIYIFLSSKIIGDTQNFVSLNSNIFIILTMAFIINQEFNFKNIRKPIIIYNLIMSVLLLLCIILNINNDNRGVMKFFSSSYDPNYMCSSFLLLFFFQIKNFFDKSNKFKYLNIIIIILYVFLCLLSGSRGITIATIIGTIIYIMLNWLKDKKKKINIKQILIFTIIVTLIIIIFKNIIPQNTLERFEIENMKSFGGRSGIWVKAIQTFVDAPLINKIIGYGMGSFVGVVQYFKYGMYLISHNIIVSLLIETGIVGIVLFVSMIFLLLKQQNKNKNFWGISLVISTLLLYLTLDMDFNFWVNIVISSFMLNSTKSRG